MLCRVVEDAMDTGQTFVSKTRVLFFILLMGMAAVMLILHGRYGHPDDSWAKIAAFFSALVAVIQVPLILSDLMEWLAPRGGYSAQGQIDADYHRQMIENENRRNGGS